MHISKSKMCFNVKSSTYYFHMKTKMLSDVQICVPLKVVSATLLLVCFTSLKESTFETSKTVFYFTSKALFVLVKTKF